MGGVQESKIYPIPPTSLIILCMQGTLPRVGNICHHSQMFAKQEA